MPPYPFSPPNPPSNPTSPSGGTNCPAGNACGNRRIHTRSWTPLNVFPAAEKGIGLRATSSIKGQTFIIEYVGEAVTGEELVRRFKQYQVRPRERYPRQ